MFRHALLIDVLLLSAGSGFAENAAPVLDRVSTAVTTERLGLAIERILPLVPLAELYMAVRLPLPRASS